MTLYRVMSSNLIKRLNGEGTIEPLIFYLGGYGGTGKSRVIHAFDHLHEVLGIKDTLKLAAFTGTAAANISGSTISSLAQISKHGKSEADIHKLETTWTPVNTLVADEVSMVGCQMLAKLDNRLSYAKHNPSEVPFGGIDMVFAGK